MSNIININVNKTDLGLNNVDNTSDLNKPISTATQTALNGKENVSNKSTNTSLGTSDTLYPTQKAVKTYVDNHTVSVPDATASVKGVIKLTGDLGGTADSPTVPALSNYLLSSLKGANNGVAELDGSGKVPSSQLPSYVDDVEEYANFAGFPVTGASGKIYIALDTNYIYRWGGTSYIEISNPIDFATQLEAEGNSENTKAMTSLRVFQSWINNITNYVVSSLTTTSKTVSGAINELNAEKQSKLSIVTPEMYGAVGDGTTDDTTSLQNAINSGKAVVLGKATYLVTSSLILTNNRTIIGYGYESKIKTTTNMSCVLIQGSNNYINGVSFLGSGKNVAGKASQRGIDITGNAGLTDDFNKNIIDNCFFTDMSGSGFYGKQVVGTYHEGNSISNCVAFNCTQGFFFDIRFEYNNTTNCKATNCNIGGRVTGGNNNFSNCNFSDNLYNLYLEYGQNNGHGSFVGGQLNHAEINNILSNGIDLGYTFNGTQIYAGRGGDAGNITLAGDNLISFVGCMISVQYFNFGTSTNTKLVGNSFDTTPTYQNYVAGNVWWGENVYKLTRPTEDPIEKPLPISRKTASYTLVASDNNKLIEMNVGSANNVTINNSVFTAGNQILVSQYGAGQVTFVAGSGVTLRSPSGKLKLTGQYSLATIIAISATEFYISGDLTA